MPIRPSQRFFYPIDWTELSARVRFERAKGACERCGRRHGETVWHLSRTEVAGRRGLWWDAEWTDGRRSGPNGRGTGRGAWRCERGRALPKHHVPSPNDLARLHTQLAFWTGLERTDWPRRSLVVLACCHLDHDPTNCLDANLAALCQHCHLEHDRADNMAKRIEGRRAAYDGRPTLNLSV